jgi:electron transport complex protein RnfD
MLRVSASPHIRDKTTTRSVMLHVVIALVPVIIASTFIFGWRAPMLFGISAASAALFEALARIVMKRKQTVGDFSAVVTGLLLAASLPANCPIWVLLIGNFVAIVVVKQMFGGLGDNFANPAVTGRIVLSVSFTAQISTYSVLGKFAGDAATDLVSSATPLAIVGQGQGSLPSTLDLFLGCHAGCIGETSVVALLIGGIFLLLTGIIDKAAIRAAELQRLNRLGYNVSLYKESADAVEPGFLFQATYDQLMNFPASDDYGYFIYLKDEGPNHYK